MRIAREVEPGNDMTRSAAMPGEAGMPDQQRDLGAASEAPQ
jgi:hypothetical protein